MRGRVSCVRMARTGGAAALLALLLLAASPARSAVWVGEDDPVSGDAALSRTTASSTYLVELPDRSLYALWYTRTGPRSSEVRGGRRGTDGRWVQEPAPISAGDSLARLPTLAVGPSGELHAAWIDNRHGNEEIYYRERDAAGVWGAEQRLTRTAEASLSPAIAAAGNGWVHVAWSEGGPGHQAINLASRAPGGAWRTPLEITDGSGNSENPVLATDGSSEAHLVWQDNIINPIVNVDDPGNVEIYYLRLDSAGQPAMAPFRVSNALGRSQRAALAVEPGGTVHIVWCDNRDRGPGGAGGTFPIALWYRRALPGLGFGHEKRFVYGIGDRLNPSVAVDGQGTINVAWEDYTTGNADIYYRQITPATGWDPFTTRLTSTPGASQGPGIIAEPNGTLHLLWTDLRSADDLNVYHRLGYADATTPVTLGEVRLETARESVEIAWRTTSEVEHAGFQIYDAPTTDAEAALVTPAVVTGAGGEYRVRLTRAQAPAGSLLKLVSISRRGEQRVEAVRVVPDFGGSEVVTEAPRPYPNPSAGPVWIPMPHSPDGPLELRIVDVRGRLVVRLSDGGSSASERVFLWNGNDDRGRRAPAGRYYARPYQSDRPVGPAATLIRRP